MATTAIKVPPTASPLIPPEVEIKARLISVQREARLLRRLLQLSRDAASNTVYIPTTAISLMEAANVR